MKNILIIDVNTERKPVIQIGKPESVVKPTTADEAKTMIINDISSACEGLCMLIHLADQNKYGNKEELVRTSVNYLNDMLII